MAVKSVGRLKSLQEKQKALAARIQKLSAAEKVKARKQELQRKVLVGAYHLELAAQNNTMDALNAAMCGWLTRGADKKLFLAAT